MGVFSKVKNFFSRAFYEGAKITQANRDFWNATADFETTAAFDRDVMRGRARWLSGNNAVMDNIDNAIVNNVIGTGIYLQSITQFSSFNDEVEARWKTWSQHKNLCDVTGRFSFSTMQRILLKSRMVDGEIFIYKQINKDGLKLQIIEADALDTSKYKNGLKIDDRTGSIVSYHFKDYSNKEFSIKSEQMINYYLPERPSQYRGISEYKQAILDIKNFSAFQTASIQGARARANIAYAVKQDGSVNNFGADAKSNIQTINGVSVMYLNKGEDISKLDPDSVATDYVQFSENTIRLIATARKISYELAFRDYSKVNFASSRASLLQDFKRFDAEQEHLITYVLNDIFKAWLEIEILSGRIKANGFEKDPYEWIKPKWVMPKRDLVDPLKEINALAKKVSMNITTETDIANSEGQDYEKILEKKSKERELKIKYGLPVDEIVLPSNMKEKPKDGEKNVK